MNRFLQASLSPRSTNSNSSGYIAVPGEHERDGLEATNNNNENENDGAEISQPVEEPVSPSVEMQDVALEIEEEEDDLPNGIKIRVLDLNGKVYHAKCLPECTVSELKTIIKGKSDVQEGLQRLIFRGQVLSDEKTVTEYKVEDGQTIHLFARQEVADPVVEETSTNDNASASNFDDHPGFHSMGPMADAFSAAVFPTDGPRRIDPLMLDNPLGNCARRVKLWSSFLLIIYTMKVLSQFALMANMHDNGRQPQSNNPDESGRQGMRGYYSPYLDQDPLISAAELAIHTFGVYVGCLGFKAAHDTIVRQVSAYVTTLIWLSILTVAEQIYLTIQMANSNYPSEPDPRRRIPSLNDIVTANILQTGVLIIMWSLAIHHARCHKVEVMRYNETLPGAIVNPIRMIVVSDNASTSNDTEASPSSPPSTTTDEPVAVVVDEQVIVTSS